MLKLPELQTRTPIVDSEGRPTLAFVRFLNVEFANAIVEAISTAEAALVIAESNDGSRVATWSSGPGGASAEKTVDNVAAPSYLEFTGTLDGGTIDADTQWEGDFTFSEYDGVTYNDLVTTPIIITSDGLMLPGPKWGVNASPVVTFNGEGLYSGTVTYRASIVQTGGANYVDGATINAMVRITPVAA